MLKNWKCPKCGKTVTEYATICDDFACDGVRGHVSWLANWDNPLGWMIGIVLLISAAMLGIVIGNIFRG